MQLNDSKDRIQSDSVSTHRGQYSYNERYFSVTILCSLLILKMWITDEPVTT